MQRKGGLTVGDKCTTIAAVVLVIFGSLMVSSAEMGNAAGNTAYLTSVIVRQVAYALIGLLAYFIFINMKIYRLRIFFYYPFYILILALLLACRAFGQINGAYAWISLPGGVTIQPSEFAKAYMIVLAGKMLGVNRHEDNLKYFKWYMGMALLYFLIIFRYQSDFGSAIVLFIICYCMMLIPQYRELRKWQAVMFLLMFGVIILAFIVMSPPFTELLKAHSDNYMVGRFLAAADPFLYQYDNGYHLIMSMVSFANGGWLGLGYGNSIHKYMNFPNPSNDFILPVIVEELGIVGFIVLVVAYGCMLYPVYRYSRKTTRTASKVVLMGVFTYFICHFILNVGGVSGIIPLTGVPLLLISSGGSSMVASLMALGAGQAEMMRNAEAGK